MRGTVDGELFRLTVYVQFICDTYRMTMK